MDPAHADHAATRPGVVEKALELCFRHRSALMLGLVPPVVVAAAAQPPLAWPDVAAGLVLVVLGLVLRLAAARAIGKRARVRDAGARDLVVAGPYGRLRNPLYVANGAILAGLGALAGGWRPGLGLAIGAWVVYSLVVHHEEGQLVVVLGEPYRRYLTEVPRWLPWPGRRVASTPGTEPWPWGEVISRERALAWVPGGILVVLGVRNGALPLGPWLDRLGAPLGLGGAVVVGALFAGAFVANVATTEVKLRRHRRSRALLAAGAPVGPPT